MKTLAKLFSEYHWAGSSAYVFDFANGCVGTCFHTKSLKGFGEEPNTLKTLILHHPFQLQQYQVKPPSTCLHPLPWKLHPYFSHSDTWLLQSFPSELSFQRPFTRNATCSKLQQQTRDDLSVMATESLHVSNTGENKIVPKVKIPKTIAEQFHVWPNMGYVDAYGIVTIQVLLREQAMKTDFR